MFDRVSVRMYDMGFGDCFLVTFWKQQSAKYVLFDCGSISRSKQEVAKVAADVASACKGPSGASRIELVVCTHRHKDHVNGFDDPVWANVEVGEVWMPWTENPKDPDATRIRERQSGFARALCKALGADLESTPLAAGKTDDRSAVAALALNALTNEKAMTTLHEGFSGAAKRRFLPEKRNSSTTRTLAELPGITFHILGPSRSEDVIKSMNPPAEAAYLAMWTGGSAEAKPTEPVGACDKQWRIDEATFNMQRLGRSDFGPGDKKKVNELADEPDGDLAAAIDNAVNNTSLVMMIEVGNQCLLFPGDAQWGTWQAILGDADLTRLLERTTMLKVSHHGSHNGTPKVLVDKILRDGTVTLVSTAPVKQWPDVPRPPLMDALTRKMKLARTDQLAKLKKRDVFDTKDGYVEWSTPVA